MLRRGHTFAISQANNILLAKGKIIQTIKLILTTVPGPIEIKWQEGYHKIISIKAAE
jgi:hypothetical protein